MKRKVTNAEIDAEMVRRGWAKPVASGWVSEGGTEWRVRPMTADPIVRLDYPNRRERVRADLQAAIDREHAAEMGAKRWDGETNKVQAAFLTASGGRLFPSKREAAKSLVKPVNAILADDEMKSRSVRTLEKHVPEQIIRRK